MKSKNHPFTRQEAITFIQGTWFLVNTPDTVDWLLHYTMNIYLMGYSWDSVRDILQKERMSGQLGYAGKLLRYCVPCPSAKELALCAEKLQRTTQHSKRRAWKLF